MSDSPVNESSCAVVVEPDNPWRVSLENCISGDNYLRASEYRDLIAELDDLYRLRKQITQLETERDNWKRWCQEAERVGRAAPELLEALKSSLAQWSPSFIHPGMGRHDPIELPPPEWVVGARAAIAKATGEQP